MENFEIILSISVTALTFLISTIAFAIKFIKAAKERNIKRIKELAEEAVLYVENLQDKNANLLQGELKKKIALNRVENACVKKNIPYSESKTDAIIENIVDISKNVNKRQKNNVLGEIK